MTPKIREAIKNARSCRVDFWDYGTILADYAESADKEIERLRALLRDVKPAVKSYIDCARDIQDAHVYNLGLRWLHEIETELAKGK